MNNWLPSPRVPQRLFKTVPEHLALETQILPELIQADFEQEVQEQAADSATRMVFRGKRRNAQGIPLPLTEAEAKAVDKAIDDTIARIRLTRQKVQKAREAIERQIEASGPAGVDFRLDISKKNTFKKAVKALFGYKVQEIDYSMYKEMVKARALLEKGEGTAYYQGSLQEPK